MTSLRVAFCFSLSIPLFSSTPRHYAVHLSTCHPPIFLPVDPFVFLLVSLFVCLPRKRPSLLISVRVCFHCHPSITLSLPCFYPKDKNSIFLNGRQTFTFLPDRCGKWNYWFLVRGKNCTWCCWLKENRYRQINKQDQSIFIYLFIFAKRQCLHAPPTWEMSIKNERSEEEKEEKIFYLECWRGCQWQSFHSTPRRVQLVGHWCHYLRSHTETARETERQKLFKFLINSMQIEHCTQYCFICIVI